MQKNNTKFKGRHSSVQGKNQGMNNSFNIQAEQNQKHSRVASLSNTLNNGAADGKQVKGSPKFNNHMLRSKVQSAEGDWGVQGNMQVGNGKQSLQNTEVKGSGGLSYPKNSRSMNQTLDPDGNAPY